MLSHCLRFQSFNFSLPCDVAPLLEGGADVNLPLITPRLSITVYPQNEAHNMVAHGTIPLAELIFMVTVMLLHVFAPTLEVRGD